MVEENSNIIKDPSTLIHDEKYISLNDHSTYIYDKRERRLLFDEPFKWGSKNSMRLVLVYYFWKGGCRDILYYTREGVDMLRLIPLKKFLDE